MVHWVLMHGAAPRALLALGTVRNVNSLVPSVAAFSQAARVVGIMSRSGRFAKAIPRGMLAGGAGWAAAVLQAPTSGGVLNCGAAARRS